MPENEIYEIEPPVPPTLMERFRGNPKLYGAWAIALLFLFLVVVLIITNLALYGQNQELISALKQRLPVAGEQTSVVIPTNKVSEARQQATVNEQHLYLLDEIQAQQLQLIQSLTNRVNRSAMIIRELESQQIVLEDQTRQLAALGGIDPNAVLDPSLNAGPDATRPEGAGEDVGRPGEPETVEGVLATTFQGVQIDELFSVDNPAFSGIVVWDYDAQSGVMQLSNLPSLPPEFRYQLWVLDPNFDNFVPGGTFDIAADAPQFEYTFRPGEEVREAIGYAVTAESAAGSPVPSGPTVVSTRNLVGKL